MPVSFSSKEVENQPKDIILYQKWLLSVVEAEYRKLEEIDYIFVNQDKIIEINKEYLNHTYETDIITFDNSYLNNISGEIYICLDVVKKNSIKHSKGNFKMELDRVIVHGLLHLIGYKDDTIEAKNVMRSKEDHYLEYLD